MHWAAHGHTAAEIIYARADAEKTNMGLTSWSGKIPRKSDVEIAKNYLDAEELNILNRIVSMYMEDWIIKLDHFLQKKIHKERNATA